MVKQKAVLIAVLALASVGCSKYVPPGYVGIKTIASGAGRGVQDYPATTGRVFYNPFLEDVLEYPIFVKTAVWTQNTHEGKPVNEEISFTTRDSMQVNADISIAYKLESEKVPHFYVMFRSDDLDSFTHGFLRNMAREKFDSEAGKFTIDQIMGDNAQFLAQARAALQKELDPIGVSIKQLGFVGAPRPPAVVIEAINMKVKANQIALQKQTEVLQAEADARKAVARAEGESNALKISSEAEAAANKRIAESLSSTLVEWKKLDKWNGQLPQVTGGSPSVLLNLGGSK